MGHFTHRTNNPCWQGPDQGLPFLTKRMEFSIDFGSAGLANVHLHMFTDGSCTEPRRPSLRVATWGVCLTNLPSQGFSAIASGGVPGFYQTVLRGEILVAIAATRFGFLHNKLFYIWTDTALVFSRIRDFAKGLSPGVLLSK